MIVVSDTSPICYLLLIDQIDVLRVLYETVTCPQIVADELSASESPLVVKTWIARPPGWLQIEPVEVLLDTELEIMKLRKLDAGEQAAILFAERMKADFVILDEKAARQVALSRGLKIIGLLGILKDAARVDLLDLETAFEQLRGVGFWVAPSLLQRLMTDEGL